MSFGLLALLQTGANHHCNSSDALPLQLFYSTSKSCAPSWVRCGLALTLFFSSFASVAFEGPLAVPAISSEKAITSPLTAVRKTGDWLVAVGQRGHILTSPDDGKTWTQANVPVSSDLVAVSFADARHGWAVGHDGVVLKTEDGGLNWNLQLDGKQTSNLIVGYYQNRVGNELYPDAKMLLDRETQLIEYGGTQPLMGVYFENENTGYVVGIFNRLLRTDDGGKTWEPWSHHIENPDEFHLYSINYGGDGLYITGEQGKVWRLDERSKKFVSISTPYGGTLFGAAVSDDRVVVFGMRGSAFMSKNHGHDWVRLALPSTANITDGMIDASGHITLVSLAGEVMISCNDGNSFATQTSNSNMPFYGVTKTSKNSVVLVGAHGALERGLVELDGVSSRTNVLVSRPNDTVARCQELSGASL